MFAFLSVVSFIILMTLVDIVFFSKEKSYSINTLTRFRIIMDDYAYFFNSLILSTLGAIKSPSG